MSQRKPKLGGFIWPFAAGNVVIERKIAAYMLYLRRKQGLRDSLRNIRSRHIGEKPSAIALTSP